MQIYYAQIHEKIENTFESRYVYYYFNSESALNDWIKWFKSQHYSLQEFVTSGKAHFNSRGILNP